MAGVRIHSVTYLPRQRKDTYQLLTEAAEIFERISDDRAKQVQAD